MASLSRLARLRFLLRRMNRYAAAAVRSKTTIAPNTPPMIAAVFMFEPVFVFMSLFSPCVVVSIPRTPLVNFGRPVGGEVVEGKSMVVANAKVEVVMSVISKIS